ncbi:MAG: hypothetical protein HY308_10640 [Gammaproteobacteria bacterium]|nr:hypothetical protein [Gammaproteobacteria bacterium]
MDKEFSFVTKTNRKFEKWRTLAAEYYSICSEARAITYTALRSFFIHYMLALNLPAEPKKYFQNEDAYPNFSFIVEGTERQVETAKVVHDCVYDFLHWVLTSRLFSQEGMADSLFIKYRIPFERIQKRVWKYKGDSKYDYVSLFDPRLSKWSAFAAGWEQSWNHDVTESLLQRRRGAIYCLLIEHICRLDLPRDPDVFLRANASAPEFQPGAYGSCARGRVAIINIAHDFLDWVLHNYYSTVDKNGSRILKSDYSNPVRRRSPKVSGKGSDEKFNYVLRKDGRLDAWRALAAEYYEQIQRGHVGVRRGVDVFLANYLPRQTSQSFDPTNFLLRSTRKENFFEVISPDNRLTPNLIKINNHASLFLEWVLYTKLSAPDDFDHPVLPVIFHNPIPRLIRSGFIRKETNKTPLPHRYVRELREVIYQGPNFTDWKWAHDIERRADWFEVDRKIIDVNDPDCVWRTVSRFRGGATRKEIIQLWSPVRAVCTLIRLHLPLRTYQARMLDSGEADTWRFVNGSWEMNSGPLAMGSARRPIERGFFRRLFDLEEKTQTTGFFINTNKTADQLKNTEDLGYVIPWQHDHILYLAEKLRNWQEKYNPIKAPVAWASLHHRHIGYKRAKKVLKTMGVACFLMRNAADNKKDDRGKPITPAGVERFWRSLLEELQRRCVARSETLHDGTPIEFVASDGTGTHFPPHALRVSILTSLLVDGGVPVPILAKCLAGHASILMTLYYNKASVTHVSEVLSGAEKKVLEKEKEAFRRWCKDATYRELEKRTAFNDVAGIVAVTENKSAAALIVQDKGICPVGARFCDIGGEVLRDIKTDRAQRVYAPVPGYPIEKNCVRCRFFITGPAFLDGLIAHFNDLSFRACGHGQATDDFRIKESLVDGLENQRVRCEAVNVPFLKGMELDQLYRQREQAAENVDKLIHDMHATHKLLTRCVALQSLSDDGIKLIPVGEISDLKFALESADTELLLLERICEQATVYTETNPHTAVLRRSQILDATLALNGRSPLFFKLTEQQQLWVGNELMMFLRARRGSLKEAVAIADRTVMLRDVGLLGDTVELLETSVAASIKLSTLSSGFNAKRLKAIPLSSEIA